MYENLALITPEECKQLGSAKRKSLGEKHYLLIFGISIPTEAPKLCNLENFLSFIIIFDKPIGALFKRNESKKIDLETINTCMKDDKSCVYVFSSGGKALRDSWNFLKFILPPGCAG